MSSSCETLSDAPPDRTARSFSARAILASLLAVAVGAAGAGLFHVLGMPAAFLTGSAAAVVVALLVGLPVELPNAVRTGSFSVLGTVMGASISIEALQQLATAPVALVGLVIVIAGTSAASAATLYFLGGWDRLTALCGSIPGNLPLVLAVSMQSGARMERVVMAQSMRLFILVALIPFAFGGGGESGALKMAPPDYGVVDVLFTLALTAAAVWLAAVARIPAPALMGPLIAGATMSLTGWHIVAIPPWMAAFALIMLGTSVALRFRGLEREGLIRMFGACVAAFIAAATTAFLTALVFAAILGRPVATLFLAFAPGGIDTMIALSFLLHHDVAFVALIHTARMIVLSLSLPAIVAWLGRRWGTHRPTER